MIAGQTLRRQPSAPARLIPPAPEPPARDLPGPELVRQLRRNSLAAWPARAYRELVVHRRFLGVDCWLISDPALVRHVLFERGAAYERPVSARRLMRPAVGAGLSVAEGPAWRAQRRLLAPMLSPMRVAGFIPHMLAAGDDLIEGIGSGGRIALGAKLESTAIDTVARAVFSLRLNAERRARIGALLRSYFGGAARASIWDFLARSEGDYGWSTRERRAFSRNWFAEVDAIVAERGVGRGDGGEPDLLDLLTAVRDETGAPLPADVLRSQAASMLATGFDTTARAMFWALCLIAQDPALQAAIRAEVRAAPAETVAALDDLERWPVLRGALLESLRLYPTLSVLSRTARSDDRLDALTIRAGSLVMVSPWVMHRHQALWTEPGVFRPGRFGARPALNFAEGPFMPFGGGRRACLGATFALTEAQLTLARLLDRFEIRLDDARPVMPVAIVTTVPSIDPYFQLTPAARG